MPGRSPTRFHTLVLPAIIAQSMIMGGGYATGREVVEYAGRFGNWGWLSVAIIALGFAIVMALSFELARLAGAYEYKEWSRNLIGPFWWLADLLILSMMLLVIAVMSAAIGEVLQQTLGLPKPLSLAMALVCVGFLAWRGSGFIEKAKTWGSTVHCPGGGAVQDVEDGLTAVAREPSRSQSREPSSRLVFDGHEAGERP